MSRINKESLHKCVGRVKQLPKKEYISIFVVLTFCFFTMFYTDIAIVYEEGFHLLDCIFGGRFFEFYEYSMNNSSWAVAPMYEFPIYVIFAIWGLPAWIIRQMVPFDILSIPCILWFKTLIMVFVVGVVREIKKIISRITSSEEQNWVVYCFLTCMIFVCPVFEIVQVDSICLFFVLWAIRNYLEGNWKKFIIGFIIATPLKMFALFAFIPLVLLKEKKILKIVGWIALTVIPTLTCSLMFRGSEAVALKNEFAHWNFSKLLYVMGFGPTGDAAESASLFVVVFFAICVVAYMCKVEEVDTKKVIYVVFAAYAALFALMRCEYPYWIVYLSPFIVMLIFVTKEHFRINLLLEMAFSTIFIFYKMFQFNWVYGGPQTYSYLLLRDVGQTPAMRIGDEYFILQMSPIPEDELTLILKGILIGCLILLLIINWPFKEKKTAVEGVIIEKSIMWARLGIIVLYILLGICVSVVDITRLLHI